MNIRSLIKTLSFEKPASVQKKEVKTTAAPEITSKGIASATDSFEASTNNFYFGKRLDTDSFHQEQDYSKGTFDASKRYTGIKLQQGRVQTDSDSNESTDVKRGSVFLTDSAFTPFKDDD